MPVEKKTPLAKNILRLLIVPWFLLGWMTHAYLVTTNPEGYRVFGESAIFKAYTVFWNQTVMPNITLFVILLIIFEIVTGCLIAAKGKWVKIGTVFGILFSLFLIQMGLSYTTPNAWINFAGNRLPNILFIALELPLLWGSYEKSLPEVIKGWFTRKNTKKD